jgi:transposase-like protein
VISAALVPALSGSKAGWMEIITRVERRRRWRLGEKLRIFAETEDRGASFVVLAHRHEVSQGLLWNWHQQVRRGALMSELMVMLLLVQVVFDPYVAARRAAGARTPPVAIPGQWMRGDFGGPAWRPIGPDRLAQSAALVAARGGGLRGYTGPLQVVHCRT